MTSYKLAHANNRTFTVRASSRGEVGLGATVGVPRTTSFGETRTTSQGDTRTIDGSGYPLVAQDVRRRQFVLHLVEEE